MLTIHMLLIISVAYTAGNPLRLAHSKDEHLKEDVISNLQLLIPLKEIYQNKNKKANSSRTNAAGHLSVVSDGRYSDIPDSEFVFDDATLSFQAPKKTIKKDLSQVDLSNVRLSNDDDKDAASSQTLLEKCRKYLLIEQLRSQWEPKLNRPLVNKESQRNDHGLLLSLCRTHLGQDNLQSKENKSVQVPNMSQSAGNFGVSGSGGVARNIGVGGQGDFGENVTVNGQGGVAGNLGIDGFAGNVGMGGKGSNSGTGKAWGDSVNFQILNGLGFNFPTKTPRLGIDGKSGGNVGIGGKGGQGGNLGVGGKGGLVGNLGIGGQGGFFGNVGIGSDANQYFDFNSGGGQGNFLGNLSGLQNQAQSYKDVKKVSLNYPQMLGVDQKGNHLPLGLDKTSVSYSENKIPMISQVHECDEKYGDMADVAGNVVVGGTASEIDNVSAAGNFIVKEEGGTGNLVVEEEGVVTNSVYQKDSDQERQVARDDKILDHNNIRCRVRSLAYGGKGGQFGNLAINGGITRNSQVTSCGHSYWIHVYLVPLGLNPKVARAGKNSLSPSSSSLSEEEATLSPEKVVKVNDLSWLRPIGGRRHWMILDGKYDDRFIDTFDEPLH